MSSSASSHTLVIDRPGCRRTQALIACLMVLALAALGHGGVPGWPGYASLLLVTGYGLREFWRASPRAACFVSRIQAAGGGAFLLGLAGDPESLVTAVVRHWWILPGVAIGLAFDAEDARRVPPVVLFRDQVPEEAWRRLAVCLRH